MKTTVDISDPLLAAARLEAERRGITLRTLVEEGLAAVLDGGRTRASYVLPDATVGGRGLRPEFAEAGWDAIRNALYEDGGPDRAR
ncbi:MAG: DUF2191 domain-containing protein [Acidimicrobiales bacterium]